MFQPFRYLFVLFYMLFVNIINQYDKSIIKVILIDVITGILFLFLIPINGTKLSVLLALIVIIADSIYENYNIKASEGKLYSKRFRSTNRYVKWGIGIIILLFLQWFTSNGIATDLSIAPETCQKYMLMSFCIYLIFGIMLEYAFAFYDYYRKNQDLIQQPYQQLKYTRMIVFGVVSSTMLLLFFALSGLLTELVRLIASIINDITSDFLEPLFFQLPKRRKNLRNPIS